MSGRERANEVYGCLGAAGWWRIRPGSSAALSAAGAAAARARCGAWVAVPVTRIGLAGAEG